MKKSYKIIFAGTPEFSCTALQSLLQSAHEVVAVYTQPDRPFGRGRKMHASPVKEIAQLHDVPVLQPVNFRDVNDQKILGDFNADLMVVVAYGILLPKVILEAPSLGCLNIHASLLPRYRGAAPIQRAILAGDQKTGVTIMQMDAGLDTGPMLYKKECEIFPDDTSQTLHDRLSLLGSEALLYTLEHFKELQPEAQNATFATYAHKLSKEEAKLDWQKTAEELALMVRGYHPWPMAFTSFEDNLLRIYTAEVVHDTKVNAKPGEIIAVSAAGILVATGQYSLLLKKLQLPGGRPLLAQDLLNGRQNIFSIGQCFS